MSWKTNISISLSSGNTPVAGGYTIRTYLSTALLSNFNGSKIRITVNGGTSSSYVVDKMYIGLQADTGDVYDFASTPTQILFSGASGFTVTAGNTLVSDAITFTIPTGKGIVISQYSASNTNTIQLTPSPSGSATPYKLGDDVTTVNATGYTSQAALWGISKIESFFDDTVPAVYLSDFGYM